MNELFYSDIFDQAEAVKATRAYLSNSVSPQLANKVIRRVIFSGAGDSYFAGYALQYAARFYQSREVQILMSNESAQYWDFREGDLLIPISVSGESKKTIQTAMKAEESGAMILPITSHPDSSLAEITSEIVLIPHQSVTRRTPHSTDYSTTLTAIAAIIEALHGKKIPELDLIESLVEQVLLTLENHGERFAVVDGTKGVNMIGGGPSFGTAQYGAAKFWEAGGSKSVAFEVEEVGHGPYMSFRENELVVLIAPEGKSSEKAQYVLRGLKTLGFEVLVLTNIPDKYSTEQIIPLPTISELWSPFLTCIPLQYLCYRYANDQEIEVSEHTRFDPVTAQKAFSFFRGTDYSELYK